LGIDANRQHILRFSSWPGFVTAIHVFLAQSAAKTWMPGTRPGIMSFDNRFFESAP